LQALEQPEIVAQSQVKPAAIFKHSNHKVSRMALKTSLRMSLTFPESNAFFRFNCFRDVSNEIASSLWGYTSHHHN
jgi:hypothetical protein